MSPILSEGLNLMVFGMGTVFVFLIVLILATHLMSTWVNNLIPESVTVNETAREAQSETEKTLPQTVDPALLRVIARAVEKHRSRK